MYVTVGTITIKINGTTKGVYLLILKLHSILTTANLLAHNICQICYCSQISLQSVIVKKVNCSFFDNLGPLGVSFTLQANGDGT